MVHGAYCRDFHFHLDESPGRRHGSTKPLEILLVSTIVEHNIKLIRHGSSIELRTIQKETPLRDSVERLQRQIMHHVHSIGHHRLSVLPAHSSAHYLRAASVNAGLSPRSARFTSHHHEHLRALVDHLLGGSFVVCSARVCWQGGRVPPSCTAVRTAIHISCITEMRQGALLGRVLSVLLVGAPHKK